MQVMTLMCAFHVHHHVTAKNQSIQHDALINAMVVVVDLVHKDVSMTLHCNGLGKESVLGAKQKQARWPGMHWISTSKKVCLAATKTNN